VESLGIEWKLLRDEGFLPKFAEHCVDEFPLLPWVEELRQEIHEETRGLENLLLDVRLSSLACLGNVIQNLPLAVLKDLQLVWRGLMRQTSLLIPAHSQQKTHQAVIQEVGSLTYVLWQIVMKNKQTTVTEADLSIAIGLTRYGKSAEIRLHAVGLLNNLGRFPTFLTDKHNVEIAKALLEVISMGLKDIPPVTLEVLVESVNSIVDIYTEDHVHTLVLKELKLLQLLENIFKELEKKAKLLSRSMGDDVVLHERMVECLSNLSQFIPYKKKEHL